MKIREGLLFYERVLEDQHREQQMMAALVGATIPPLFGAGNGKPETDDGQPDVEAMKRARYKS